VGKVQKEGRFTAPARQVAVPPEVAVSLSVACALSSHVDLLRYYPVVED
jgi:hypothetical protein